jgi:hypothetical protein
LNEIFTQSRGNNEIYPKSDGVWEWSFDSPKIQMEESNGGKGEENGFEKMRINH